MRECQLCKNCFSDDVATCPNDGMPTAQTIAGEPVLEGKYHLESRLGQGGMGVVYKARHAYLKTQLAIKIILPDLVGNDPQLVTRFRQEALAAAAIRHQNVVSVTDYGVVNGAMPFLVMEYVEGESLHDLLAREQRLSPERALDLMTAICAGVGAAHHQGIVHRDLKPLNVMICNDKPSLSQAVKILDFGLAKIKSGELLGSFIQAQTTGLMGSPYYMAPEQWADEDPDTRADIYSLGVMLYQMLAGDVPFKGSSIPAIMKKHISDPPPPFSELGVSVPYALEQAVFHTLEKNPVRRTQTVEILVQEMRAAIEPLTSSSSIHMTTGHSLPVSSLRILTRPASSKVFVDNVAVGMTTHDGELRLDGVQSGNHLLRISKPGFQDWVGDVVCDGSPMEVVAELRSTPVPDVNAIPKPTSGSVSYPNANSEGATQSFQRVPSAAVEQTMQQNAASTMPPVFGAASIPPKKSFFSPLVLGITGIFGLLVLVTVGVVAAYMFGVIGPAKPDANSTNRANTSNSSTPGTTPTPIAVPKTEMVSIPGGTFQMGRNTGREEERPEHPVTVKPFRMDKTEVTNAEYYAFVRDTGYRPVPSHWVNDKPKPGQENMPVRDVNIADITAFASWRSKRDGGVVYRLPTEAEWEYAARNGDRDNLYPWGDSFKPKCAVIDKPLMEPEIVGTESCPNMWGVQDLIGNVYEWTSSVAEPYPGAVAVKQPTEVMNAVRGGCAQNNSAGEYAITSTYRQFVPVTKRDLQLGFRLVTDG